MRIRLGTVAMVVVLASAARGAPIPTLGDAQGAFGAGEYRKCLSMIAGRLGDSRSKVTPDERYELLMLRGESFLRLGQQQPAFNAFEMAFRVYRLKGDLYKGAVAKATAILVKSSPGLRYGARGSEGESINIVVPDTRGTAMKALLEDRLAELTPRVQSTTAEADALGPLQALVPAVRDAYAIELAATHANERTAPLARAIGERARSVMRSELERMADRVEALALLAGEPADADLASPGQRGLKEPERQELQQITTAIQKMQVTGQSGRQTAKRLGASGDAWNGLLADCAEVRGDVDELLGAK